MKVKLFMLHKIRVQLPGNRHHYLCVHENELIRIIKQKIADNMKLHEQNWSIYINKDNRLKIVDDELRLCDIMKPGIHLHFYPKVVIR